MGLKSLQAGLLPPTVGLSEPEPDAVGMVSDAAQPIRGRYLLSTNSGFGGVNAALIFSREEA